MATVHSFKGVRDNVDKTRKDSIRTKFAYPPEVFNWYKSAEVHTHKFHMPWKIWMLFLIPFLIGLCVFFVWRYFDKKIHPEIKPPVVAAAGSPAALANAAANAKLEYDPASFKPRIEDLPWTAPRYDSLTQPTVAPQIMGCMIYRKSCKCMTQQGTYHKASMDFCLSVVNDGLFHDFEQTNRSGLSSEARPDSRTTPVTPSPSANVAPAPRADSEFNLPLKSPVSQYSTSYATQPSGAVVHKPLPSSAVMFGGVH